MHGAKAKAEPAGLECNEKWCSRELLPGLFGRYFRLLVNFLILGRLDFLRRDDELSVRQHDLSGNLAKPNLLRVVDEGHPFFVPAGTFRGVGRDIVPLPAKNLHHSVERREIAIDLLNGDQVKTG